MKKLLFVFAFFVATASIFSQVNILVVYYSKTGHTKYMATIVAEGAMQEGKTHVRLLEVGKATPVDGLWADAIIVGSPVYNPELSDKIAKTAYRPINLSLIGINPDACP